MSIYINPNCKGCLISRKERCDEFAVSLQWFNYPDQLAERVKGRMDIDGCYIYEDWETKHKISVQEGRVMYDS
ncbi:hypothetical protein [uncultured Duncaniella sp.]|uniref:hypothetical protein n=1 Tax=uncultured Duncaniella sp. TaxID=2768039 RepID=UPI00261D763C|nr:hypothetical protein [uncultured Duncaniella sp.]